MQAFNLSMFDKQSWKLLPDSSSLLTRVLKAKYFQRRDFSDATLGHIQSTLGGVFGVLNNDLFWVIYGRLVTTLKLMCETCLGCKTSSLLSLPLLHRFTTRT